MASNNGSCALFALTDLVAKSIKIFKRLCSHKLISEKELKYLTYHFRKSINLGKLYFLPKTHKRLSAVPLRPVISNCGTPTEFSEYLNYILKPIMQDSWSYIKDSGDYYWQDSRGSYLSYSRRYSVK